MSESFDLSHRETQTSSLPSPLDKIGFWEKVGTWALPASSLSLASALVFAVTLVFLQRNREIRALFVLPRWPGFVIMAVVAGLAWTIVILCGRRPGRLWPRAWALFLAGLNSLVLALLSVFPEVTFLNAVGVAGAAAVLALLPRLVPLSPDSHWIPKIAPLAGLLVLLPVLFVASCVGESIAASKRDRVSGMIEQLREHTAEVKTVTGRDWSGGGWDDAARAVEGLGQIQWAGKLDRSLWREALTLGRDTELAEEARKLLDATAAGFDENRVPRVSFLRDPAFYYDVTSRSWEKSSAFPKASETVGRYFLELGRIFQELEVQDSFAESTALEELKKNYLDRRSKLKANLQPQMEQWTDHWALFRIPGREDLVGYSEMPLGRLLQIPLPALKTHAADLPNLLGLTYQEVRDLGRIPGCRPLAPYKETSSDGNEYQYSRLDCYSYSPLAEGLGADPRVEMRLVYKSAANRYLLSDQKPAEVYYLFTLPKGKAEDEFQKQVMSDLAEAVRETSGKEVTPVNRSNSVESGFRVRGQGRTVVVYKPQVIPLFDDRKGLQVRAERMT